MPITLPDLPEGVSSQRLVAGMIRLWKEDTHLGHIKRRNGAWYTFPDYFNSGGAGGSAGSGPHETPEAAAHALVRQTT